MIRSKEECILALKKLGYQLSHDSFTGRLDAIPAGCSIKNTDMALHFETSPTGVGSGRNDLTPICKDPTGNFRFIWFSIFCNTEIYSIIDELVIY